MKLGFLTACLPHMPLEKIVSWASVNGFSALELAAWPVGSERDYKGNQVDVVNLNKEKANRLKSLFQKNNLVASALAYYDNNLHPDLKTREVYHQHLRRVIDGAELLDIKLVGTFVGARTDISPAENVREIGRVFRDLLKYAADRNVKIMIENCPMDNWVSFGRPGNFAYSPELWEALFNEIQAENFGLNFDPSHLYWLGIDYIQAVRDFGPKIFHTHAKDTEILVDGKNKYGILGRQIEPQPWKSGWWRYRIPGSGEIDWKKFIDTLQESGYDNTLSIEHEDPVWEGSEEKIKRGLLLGLKHLSPFIV